MTQVYNRRINAGQPRRKTTGKRRNAVTTRAAILESARTAFARAGYDGVGLREIAAGAGVTAMLVNRYFGSKHRLFGEVVADIMSRPIILAPENLQPSLSSEEMAAALVRVTASGDLPLEGFRIMLYSAASSRAAEIGREQIEAGSHKTLTAALRGKHAPQRAALILALVSGIQVMRQMVKLKALADCPPQTLVRLLVPVFRQLIEA